MGRAAAPLLARRRNVGPRVARASGTRSRRLAAILL
jgi:hypothetical protein